MVARSSIEVNRIVWVCGNSVRVTSSESLQEWKAKEIPPREKMEGFEREVLGRTVPLE